MCQNGCFGPASTHLNARKSKKLGGKTKISAGFLLHKVLQFLTVHLWIPECNQRALDCILCAQYVDERSFICAQSLACIVYLVAVLGRRSIDVSFENHGGSKLWEDTPGRSRGSKQDRQALPCELLRGRCLATWLQLILSQDRPSVNTVNVVPRGRQVGLRQVGFRLLSIVCSGCVVFPDHIGGRNIESTTERLDGGPLVLSYPPASKGSWIFAVREFSGDRRQTGEMIGYFLHLTRACPRPVPPARRRPAPCNAVAESVLSLLSIFWRCCPSSALLSGLGIGSQDTIALGRYIDERHLLGEGPPGNQRFVERKHS